MTSPVAILILAAGSSNRLGQSKQLLMYNHITLLEKSIHESIQSQVGEVFVVLGANEEEHRKVIAHLPVTIISNPTWKKGMGNSMKTGLSFVMDKHPLVGGILILVCDQPALSSFHLQKLQEVFQQTQIPIVASQYDDTVGVPAFFHRVLFDDLLQVPDDSGAKKIISRYPHQVKSLKFEGGELDIDTPEDYQRWIKRS
jgi:molybdenum cofactor cytidylyltransferase